MGPEGIPIPKEIGLVREKVLLRGSSHLPVGLQGQQAGGHSTVQFTEDVHT